MILLAGGPQDIPLPQMHACSGTWWPVPRLIHVVWKRSFLWYILGDKLCSFSRTHLASSAHYFFPTACYDTLNVMLQRSGYVVE